MLNCTIWIQVYHLGSWKVWQCRKSWEKERSEQAGISLFNWLTAQSFVDIFPFMGICGNHISIWIGELRVPESFKFSRSSELMLFGNLNSVGRSLWLADNDLNMSPCQPCQTSLTLRESVFFKWRGCHKHSRKKVGSWDPGSKSIFGPNLESWGQIRKVGED